MEKGNYVISKSLPNLRDQHSKMETSQEQSLYTYTYVRTYVRNVTFHSNETKLNMSTHPYHPSNSCSLYKNFFLQKMWDGKPNETMFQNRLISNIVLIH